MSSIFILAIVIIATAFSANAGCPKGDAGVCVGIYDANGNITSYTCSTGATSAPKDCATSTGGGDESVEPM